MLIAMINGDTIGDIADYRSLFPNTSFPSNGPNADFFEQYSCLPVCTTVAFDYDTQELQPTEPYIQDGKVYTVKAVDLKEPRPKPVMTDVFVAQPTDQIVTASETINPSPSLTSSFTIDAGTGSLTINI